jgi:AraC-like DNA-binding protein
VLRFQPILYECPELAVLERSQSVLLRLAPLARTELAVRVRTEFGISALMRLMRHVGAPAAAVRGVAFAHQAPPYAHEYTHLFGDRARFGRACSGIEIDSVWLDRRLHGANVELYQVLTLQAQQVLARLQSAVRYVDQVRDYLRLQFPRLPEMRETARAVALSERSLRRRLAEEGWSYSAILQESQLLLAQQRLADPACSIQQVASYVGFTSTAAFHRAFKRWTGESPAVFRSAGTRARPIANV